MNNRGKINNSYIFIRGGKHMKANLRTCKSLLVVIILFSWLISVSVSASTITFGIDDSYNVKLDLNAIDTLDPNTWGVIELGKKADNGYKQFKLTGKKIKTEKKSPWEKMSGDDWTNRLKNFLGVYFNHEVLINSENYEDSTPVHSPIPATVWIFGSGLIALIIARRKYRSSVS
jgi:hypothetical protein